MTSNTGQVYNVALFGDVGSGKSSIINLLAEKPVANVSAGVDICTKRARWYQVTIEDKDFRLWDTMGFNQPEAQNVSLLSPFEQAYALLRNLPNGPDLILLCAREDGISASVRSLYWLLNSFFFGGQAKVALVLTHFDTPDDGWWDRNKRSISQKCNIPESLPHACVTTVRDGSAQSESLYDQSKKALRSLLKIHATTSETAPAVLSLDLSSNGVSDEDAENLKNYFKLNNPEVQKLVEKSRSPKRSYNVILFGDTGAGKSSVINLLVGKPAAEVSSRMQNCTLDFGSYEVNTGLYQFLIWDTVGFNGTYDGKDLTVMAFEKAAQLVRELHSKGGVDLLVFCKHGGCHLMWSELSSLRLFHEFLCERQVPVAFIITHLESWDPMEEWWKMNGDDVLKGCGVAEAEHACIASKSDSSGDEGHCNRLLRSRELIQTMLEDSISHGNGFRKEEGIWVVSFLTRLAEMVGVGSSPRKISAKNLMTRCGLTKEQAEEVVRSLRTPLSQRTQGISKEYIIFMLS